MPDGSSSPRGVFLSYAREDSESVQRLADALRGFGLEVWFDQNELRGGDAWDQKIRRQIKECALFVPVISQNTQARTEGYFRLEWRLAEQRTFLMAKGRPFLLPIVIDGTRDGEAHVPDSFLEVQWSRIPGGKCDAEFAALAQRLLDWDGSAPPHEPASTAAPAAGPTHGNRRPALAYGAITAIAIGAAAAIWVATRRDTASVSSNKPPPASSSPAQALVAQVWDLLLKPEMARAELDAAELLCARATQLDPTDAEAWAAWATVDTWFYYYSFDRSPARRQRAHDHASRARQLAPDSLEARLAEATLMIRIAFMDRTDPTPHFAEAIGLLRPLLAENPAEPRAMSQLGFALLWQGETEEEGRRILEQVAMNPAFAAKAWNEIAWHHFWRQHPRDAEAAVERSIAAAPYWDNLSLKAKLQLKWHGDLAGARATIDRITAPARREEVGAITICEVLRWCRQPAELADYLASFPREWLYSNEYYGPTSFLAGQARLEAGQRQTANQSFAVTLRQLEPALLENPDVVELHYLKAATLHYLGEAEAAGQAYRLAVELGPTPPLWIQALMEPPGVVIGRVSAELDRTSRTSGLHVVETNTTAASLRLSPIFDPLRGDPRFAELVARAEADPRRSPNPSRPTPQH
jgi:cytochrome c-type biogenesis protein CcmH/NrfG